MAHSVGSSEVREKVGHDDVKDARASRAPLFDSALYLEGGGQCLPIAQVVWCSEAGKEGIRDVLRETFGAE